MLKHIGQVAEDGAALLEARGRILIHQLRRAGVDATLWRVSGLLGAAGALTLVSALAVALAEPLGTAGALAVAGGSLLVVAIVAVAAVRARRGPDSEEQKLALEVSAAREIFLTA